MAYATESGFLGPIKKMHSLGFEPDLKRITEDALMYERLEILDWLRTEMNCNFFTQQAFKDAATNGGGVRSVAEAKREKGEE